ncbi:hypothetical protein STRIP9103_06130 [Streptomyces ipomoeae 91-03]|uniref:Uncharacterized protein n=1 Tax=Streptomyces ipomoeae 91-03 TaxID=698759 RepID=L1KSR4_9ACTN|nr:hypothetical protein STRIP9103_06130 [Streptomyces ipomoeae 91-03]
MLRLPACHRCSHAWRIEASGSTPETPLIFGRPMIERLPGPISGFDQGHPDCHRTGSAVTMDA